MTRCGLMAAVLAICAWISLPIGSIAVSLQTLGVLLCLGLLGGKLGTASILVYLTLGAMGAPVFTGFQGGLATLTGPTGGYLWGFFLAGVLFCCMEKKLPLWISYVLCQLIIYITGTLWYCIAYAPGGLGLILLQCVLPYLIPDVLKLLVATQTVKKYGKYLFGSDK